MDLRILIDSLVQQTTVLIAQLSTAAGVRAPLAHVADRVFVSLARELETQGVGKNVVADMFGLALRTYQRRMQRLAGTNNTAERTLWEAVLDHVSEKGSITRAAVLERFRFDGEKETIAVLSDLVSSGLVFASGRGASTLYGATSEAQRQHMSAEASADTLTTMAWGAIYRTPGISRDELVATLRVDAGVLDTALATLKADDRVAEDPSGKLHTSNFVIPVGSEHGWEGAVFDHFQAVATAIALKVNKRAFRAQAQDVNGGGTLRFQLSKDHPYAGQVLGLLERVRNDSQSVWAMVSAYNREHPIAEDERIDTCFYFGQSVFDRNAEEATEGD
jgi:hypothetical protein